MQQNRIMGHQVGQQLTDEELDLIAGGNTPICQNGTIIACGPGNGPDCRGCKNDGTQ